MVDDYKTLNCLRNKNFSLFICSSNSSNWYKLDFCLASTVFKDPSQLTLYDEEHSSDEDRWITIGLDGTGVVQLVIHTFERIDQESFLVRIISARKASVNEQNVYQRRKR